MSCGEEYQGAPYLRLVEESHEVKVSIATLSAKTHWRDWCDGRPIGAVSLNGFVRPARKASSCSKSYGWVMVVTGGGATISLAQQRANGLAERVLLPNLRYRRVSGDRLISGDYARVEKLGLLTLHEDVTERVRSADVLRIGGR
jgi:hypothetical protein